MLGAPSDTRPVVSAPCAQNFLIPVTQLHAKAMCTRSTRNIIITMCYNMRPSLGQYWRRRTPRAWAASQRAPPVACSSGWLSTPDPFSISRNGTRRLREPARGLPRARHTLRDGRRGCQTTGCCHPRAQLLLLMAASSEAARAADAAKAGTGAAAAMVATVVAKARVAAATVAAVTAKAGALLAPWASMDATTMVAAAMVRDEAAVARARVAAAKEREVASTVRAVVATERTVGPMGRATRAATAMVGEVLEIPGLRAVTARVAAARARAVTMVVAASTALTVLATEPRSRSSRWST